MNIDKLCDYLYPLNPKDVRPIQQSSLRIRYSNKFSRKKSLEVNKLIESAMDNLENGRIDPSKPASKFRLSSLTVGEKGDLLLEIGPTNYQEYLCTNNNNILNSILIQKGELDHNDPDAYLSNTIGNLAIVETTDSKIALLLRSFLVATYQGYYDAPGGHPEPYNAKIAEKRKRFSKEQAICHELFSSIRDEVVEELNVESQDIISTSFLGIIRNLDDGRKPEMIFYVPINISSDELQERYENSDNFEGKKESSKLLLIDSHQVVEVEGKLTIPAIAAISLYHNMIDI